MNEIMREVKYSLPGMALAITLYSVLLVIALLATCAPPEPRETTLYYDVLP